MKKIWLPAFLFFFFAGQVFSQNAWQISGHVRNETGEALPGSLVQINDSIGVVANAEGYFEIQSPQRPAEVTVRSLGYFSRRILLQNADFQNRKAVLEITLTSQATELKEVSISAKKVEVLAEENFSTDIYDYEFAGENLLLLVRERKRFYARLTNESGEKLDEIQLAGQPTVLHRSCTGSLHLVGSEFAQELTINTLRLDTFSRYPLQKFRQFVEPCVEQSRGHYFFRTIGLFNKSVTYVYFDPSGRRHFLAEIKDAAGEAEAMDAYGAFRSNKPMFVERPGLPPLIGITHKFNLLNNTEPANIFSDAALQHHANTNDQLAHWSWLQALKMDSVYAPLLKIGDTLLLFDHVRGEIWSFSVRFSDEKTIPIRYHKEVGWKKELLKDEATQAVYAHFAPNDRHVLRKIDLADGKITAEYPLNEVPHISQNFKVKNGFLYFLGRADANVPNASLYKVHIFQKIAAK